jgi:transcriptional regulator with XRE-family HTH domain
MDAITSDAGMAIPDQGDDAALAFTIADLRRELGLTQQEFGERIGLPNKTSISLLESGKRPNVSAAVAVAIEELSGGRIDAAALSDDVKIARHGLGNTPEGAQDHAV